jgi:hypothetical protein
VGSAEDAGRHHRRRATGAPAPSPRASRKRRRGPWDDSHRGPGAGAPARLREPAAGFAAGARRIVRGPGERSLGRVFEAPGSAAAGAGRRAEDRARGAAATNVRGLPKRSSDLLRSPRLPMLEGSLARTG